MGYVTCGYQAVAVRAPAGVTGLVPVGFPSAPSLSVRAERDHGPRRRVRFCFRPKRHSAATSPRVPRFAQRGSLRASDREAQFAVEWLGSGASANALEL